MATTSTTSETTEPIKITLSVSLEIAGLTDELAESLQEAVKDLL